jgi:4a-hydroxytetrahydrobiopterin dehydratase
LTLSLRYLCASQRRPLQHVTLEGRLNAPLTRVADTRWLWGMSPLLTDAEVSQQLARLPNWRRAETAEPAIMATYELADFVAALDFVNQVGHEAELVNHHPDIDIRWNKVTLVLSTHSEGGLTKHDIELAHRINEVVDQEE